MSLLKKERNKVGQPEVLFLDEPTTGLDPRTRQDLWSIIEDPVAGGTTLLPTTQYLKEGGRLAERIALIDHGTGIAEGSADDLKHPLSSDVLELTLLPEDFAPALGVLETLLSGNPILTKARADSAARRGQQA